MRPSAFIVIEKPMRALPASLVSVAALATRIEVESDILRAACGRQQEQRQQR